MFNNNSRFHSNLLSIYNEVEMGKTLKIDTKSAINFLN